jgi:hypothetical protein
MLIRGMQGGFIESMASTKEIEPTLYAIIKHIHNVNEHSVFAIAEITANDIVIEKSVYDSRNGWNTHTVILNGFPVAYINCPIGE